MSTLFSITSGWLLQLRTHVNHMVVVAVGPLIALAKGQEFQPVELK